MPATATTPAAAYSYLRFSSDEQKDGDSERRQIELRDDWLKRHPHVSLDTSQVFEDKGVSGFRGKHRTAGHKLAEFLELVERGRIPAGSFLILESLDRLTREEPSQSIKLVLALTDAGIKVVQLTPWEAVYEKGQDMGRFFGMVVETFRSHGESLRKRGMNSEAWDRKRRAAREEGKAIGGCCPAWLEFVPSKREGKYIDGSYVPLPKAMKAVARVFQLSAEGLGAKSIAERLNAEGVPAIGRKGEWLRTYVKKLLKNRAVLGEFQPMKDGKPDGEAIPDFFPRAVSETLWLKARDAMRTRTGRGVGMGGKRQVHLFSGLLRSALDLCPLVTREHRVKGGSPRKFLASAAAVQGRHGAHPARFPLDVFTDAIIGGLKEVKVEDVFASHNSERIVKLEAEFATAERRLNNAKARWEADQENTAWADLIDKWGRKRNALAKEMQAARMEAANPLTATWAEASNLMKAKQQRPEQLRAAFLKTIEAVYCVFAERGRDRLARVQVFFHRQAEDGPQPVRCFGIFLRSPLTVQVGGGKGSKTVRKPGSLYVTNIKHPDDDLGNLENYDLRDWDQANGIKEMLEDFPDDILERLFKLGQPVA
jgi:DNA invertase Pin-like site-specific DNA recombinase